jgi:DNA polymerase I-like protein with 3'-5' exonuclease and polymerase domains
MMIFLDTEYTNSQERDVKPIIAVSKELSDDLQTISNTHRWNLLTEPELLREYIENVKSPVVCWSAQAEARVLDVIGVDIRNVTWLDGMVCWKLQWSGNSSMRNNSLLDAASWYNVSYSSDKEYFRSMILSGKYLKQLDKVLDYCEEDVNCLVAVVRNLLPECLSTIGISRERLYYLSQWSALLALVEKEGIPIDAGRIVQLRENHQYLTDHLIYALCSQTYPFYRKINGKWHKNDKRFARYIEDHGYDKWWPKTISGKYSTDADDLKAGDSVIQEFNGVQRACKQLQDWASGRRTAWDSHFGSDGRLRPYFNPYGTLSGRNAPAESQFIFAMPSVWRCLIRAPKGFVIVSADWKAQEFAVSAVLSQDPAMKEAYNSGDVYLWWGKKLGVIPPEGTAKTHAKERKLFKIITLGLSYGMGGKTLARHVYVSSGQQISNATADNYVAAFRQTYPHYARFSDWFRKKWKQVRYGEISSHWQFINEDGWGTRVSSATRCNTFVNFPIQSKGAVMLRRAVIDCLKDNIRVISPLHDGIYAICPDGEVEDIKRRMAFHMDNAVPWAFSKQLKEPFKFQIEFETHRPEEDWVEDKGRHFYEIFSTLLNWRTNGKV